jgi:hypothetical protein
MAPRAHVRPVPTSPTPPSLSPPRSLILYFCYNPMFGSMLMAMSMTLSHPSVLLFVTLLPVLIMLFATANYVALGSESYYFLSLRQSFFSHFGLQFAQQFNIFATTSPRLASTFAFFLWCVASVTILNLFIGIVTTVYNDKATAKSSETWNAMMTSLMQKDLWRDVNGGSWSEMVYTVTCGWAPSLFFALCPCCKRGGRRGCVGSSRSRRRRRDGDGGDGAATSGHHRIGTHSGDTAEVQGSGADAGDAAGAPPRLRVRASNLGLSGAGIRGRTGGPRRPSNAGAGGSDANDDGGGSDADDGTDEEMGRREGGGRRGRVLPLFVPSKEQRVAALYLSPDRVQTLADGLAARLCNPVLLDTLRGIRQMDRDLEQLRLMGASLIDSKATGGGSRRRGSNAGGGGGEGADRKPRPSAMAGASR